MKNTRFLLAALALASAPVLAAPAASARPTAATPPLASTSASASTSTSVAPAQIDAAAIALLDKTIAAYAQTQTLSQDVGWKLSLGAQTRAARGSWDFARPGRARLVRTNSKGTLTIVGDGTTVFSRAGKDSDFDKGDGIEETSEYLFSGPFSSLGLIFRGINPLTFPVDLGWKSATVMPDGNGIVFKVQADPHDPIETIDLRINPETHLIALARFEVTVQSEDDGTPQKFASSITLKPRPVTFAPAIFQIKLPTGRSVASLMKPSRNYSSQLKIGAQPFALTGQTLDGKTLSLDDYKGKVVLLDFWATWCGPCVGELPMVKATYNKYHDEGFEVVGVSLDQSEADLRGFIKARAMPWPQIFDQKPFRGPNATNYKIAAIPFTLLIGKDGKIVDVNARGWHLPLAVEKALQAPAS